MINKQMGNSDNMNSLYAEKGDTWPKVLMYNYKKYGAKHKAIRHKHYGIWEPYTWKDYFEGVKYFALGLLSLGFKPGDKLMIIGDNAPHWYYGELAAQANHGISVGVYSELSASEVKYIAENSEAAFAMVEDQEQVDKLLEIKNELPFLKKIIYWNYKGLGNYDEAELIGYNKVIQSGKEYEKNNPGIFEQNVETGKADDVCVLVYTSGTTGETPKGAMHTYRSMKSGSEFYLQLDSWHENDNIIPYRPPAWMTEQWLNIGCHLLSGSTLNFAEDPETLQRDIKESNPSIVFYSARLWESQASEVFAQMLDADALKRYLFNRFLSVGYSTADLKRNKTKRGLLDKISYFLANLLIFKPVKSKLGLSNAIVCYTTEAVLSPEAYKFYHAMNIPLKSLYSSTEGGVLTGSCNDEIDINTSGMVQEGMEIKITETGELTCRQPGLFVGYYNDPDRTSEVLKDGWYYSGDCCEIRDDGHLVFVERLDDLIELADGSRLAPQSIESRLRFSPFIKDAWVLSDDSGKYVSAVIVIDYKNVGKWAGKRRIDYKNLTELSQKSEVYDLVKEDIERINSTLPSAVQIKKYINLYKSFDPDDSELTRTRNLKRKILNERYREIINAIYSSKDNIPVETIVSGKEGRTETININLQIKTL